MTGCCQFSDKVVDLALGADVDAAVSAFESGEAPINSVEGFVRQILGWALLYNATAIPLAVTGLLNPLFAALAMSASSLLVVWNSSRPIGGAGAGQS